MSTRKNLQEKVNDIGKVFSIQKVLDLKVDKKYIQKYYQANKLAYSIFHTKTDLIYMGISRDGIYKESDLLEAARTVEKYLKNEQGMAVLELATGRGASSFYLAKIFPQVKFFGVDISKGQLDFALKKAKKVNNYFPEMGDYHNLKRYKDGSFDIVFIIEALCYSLDKDAVLKEVFRVLKSGGLFIIFDGYCQKKIGQMTEIEKRALHLTEKGMALEKFEEYCSFKEKAKNYFKTEYEEDASKYVIPTMERFEKTSSYFFRFPRLSKFLSKILPEELYYNLMPAYLMPEVMRKGVCCYMINVLRK